MADSRLQAVAATVPAATPAGAAERWSALLPGLVLLLACGLFVLAADRGIDLTDEAYYLLQYAHWRDFSFHVTLFGLYWEGPFRLLSGNVAAMRIAGALVLMLAGLFFAQQLAAFARQCLALPVPASRPSLLAVMAFALYFFAPFGTLRLPSYNTASLAAELVATGALLGLVRHAHDGGRGGGFAFAYGLAMSVCLFSKATTAASLFMLHLLLLGAFKPCWPWQALPAAVGWGALGAIANVGWVQAAKPDWWEAATRGVTLMRMMEERDLLMALRGVSWDLQHFLAANGWLPLGMVLVTLAGLGVVRRWPSLRPTVVLAIALCLSASVSWQLVLAADRRGGLLVLGLAVLLLWLLGRVLLRDQGQAAKWRQLMLLLILLALPLAFSLGTNMALAWHTQLAAIFPLSALVLMLWHLQGAGLLARAGSHLVLTVLSLPALVAQAQPWLMADRVYRGRGPLIEQTAPLSESSRLAGVRTDIQLRDDLAAFQTAMADQGFSGQAMLDFTGDGHGLIYAAGGRTLGTAWLLGGYPGSGEAARYMLENLAVESLRQAWILSSPASPRRIRGWETMLEHRLGAQCHERVAVVPYRSPYSGSKGGSPASFPLYIWRPLQNCRQPAG